MAAADCSPRPDERRLVRHVYLACFEKQIDDATNPKGSVSHYLGWAEDVELRWPTGPDEEPRILAACRAGLYRR